MRIGLVSVFPSAKTGYSVISRGIVHGLLDNHEITWMANSGDTNVWGGTDTFDFPDGKRVETVILPNPLQNADSAADVVNSYIQQYKFDVVIGNWDNWALEFMKKIKAPTIIYPPVDSRATRKWMEYSKGTRRIVAYSWFGYQEMCRFFPRSRVSYIAHGVNTSIFKPLGKDKPSLRSDMEHIGREGMSNKPIPQDCFLFTFVGANMWERKNIPLLMETFGRFHAKHENAYLYLHTNFMSTYPGYDLPMIAEELGVSDYIIYPKRNPIISPATDEQLNLLYNASDCFVMPSSAEGFCVPLLEAQSAGLPAIASRNSAMTELVHGHGWLIDQLPRGQYVDYPHYVPTGQANEQPNMESLLIQMEDAYSNERKRLHYGREARKFAEGYSWSKVIPRWEQLLREVAEENLLEKDLAESLKRTNLGIELKAQRQGFS